ncbi:RNA methyltransferase [Pontibacter silvestris]|uniref:RNA methyltransferase n=2 Tax=Pontibacter silvestris TaxID=2305183 RepID=A0ABW4WVE1_9BACT|nr:RNA methyltransferase [Pontibacter silvestris]MCC9137268.1 RNA methyltransferase [Pontibacter silvestris]
MSVTLLWALMLNGQEVVAFSCSAENAASKPSTELAKEQKQKTVVKQKVSLEATTSFVALNLQQAIKPTPIPAFAVPADEALPAFTARPPGLGFVAQICPITIQPNAP